MKTRLPQLAAIAFLIFISGVDGKRLAPVPVPSVRYGNLEISAPLGADKIGVVEARDIATGKLAWEKRIYEVRKNPLLEGDVQWVFISSLDLKKHFLIVTNEKKQRFQLDLKTKEVTRLNSKAGF